ncbi:MAG: 50S ribosomal protein L19e [Candidatus Aenigmatarchaeota archaeon]
MVNLQKKIASKILKCGLDRVWIDPTNVKVKQAITRKDIKRFIKEGAIKKIPEKKKAKHKEKKQQRAGSKKGSKFARIGKKSLWLKVVRPQRKLLKELKKQGKLKPHSYRMIYKLIKGNFFRSKAHLMTYLKEKELIKEDKNEKNKST